MEHTQSLLVLDFGSQYTQLIARRVRELGVYSEIHPFQYSVDHIQQLQPVGVLGLLHQIGQAQPQRPLAAHRQRLSELIREKLSGLPFQSLWLL